jgi:hypothetical protein
LSLGSFKKFPCLRRKFDIKHFIDPVLF